MSSKEALMRKVQSIRDNAKRTANMAVSAGITLAAAGGIGYLHGRKGEVPTIKKVPYDALGAGVLYVAALFSPARYQMYALSAANGFGAYFVGGKFAQMGQKARNAAHEPGTALTDATLEANFKQGDTGQTRTIVKGGRNGERAAYADGFQRAIGAGVPCFTDRDLQSVYQPRAAA